MAFVMQQVVQADLMSFYGNFAVCKEQFRNIRTKSTTSLPLHDFKFGFSKKNVALLSPTEQRKRFRFYKQCVPSILVVCVAADLIAVAVSGRVTLSTTVGVAGVAVKSKMRSELLMTTKGEKRSN